MGPMRSSTFDLQVNGTTMGVRRWLPEGDAVGLVQVCHGMAEHGGRYEQLAQHLTDAGWAVVAGDHRGHGLTARRRSTSAPAAPLGHFADRNGWDTVVEDVRALALHATTQHPGVPHVLLGHSMGSLLARDYATRWGDELAGLVLSGTPAPAGVVGRAGRALAATLARVEGPRSTAKLMHRLTFGSYNAAFKPNRTEYDWLSSVEADVDSYVDDPLCGFTCTNAFYVDLITGLDRVNLPKVAARTPKGLPIWVLGGQLDPAGGPKAVTALVGLLEGQGVELVTATSYAEGRHEMFHEAERQRVFDELVTWLDERR